MAIKYGTNGANSIAGTNSDDQLYGGPSSNPDGDTGADTLNGLAGSDWLAGYGGNDVLLGGLGYDIAYGGNGADSIDLGGDGGEAYGEAGNDTITGQATSAHYLYAYGGADNDLISISGSYAYVYGEAGNDTIAAVGMGKSLLGGAGADSIVGSDGDDDIGDDDQIGLGITSSENDTLLGGAGNDFITSTGGADSIDGGAGNDTVTVNLSGAAGAVIFQPTGSTSTVSFGAGLSSVVNVEVFEVRGTSFADQLAGLSGNDTLRGDGGGDTLAGGAGYDYLYGEAGNDSIDVGADGYADGGEGHDTLSASASTDVGFEIHGGAGNDLLTSSGSFYGNLYGNGGNDTLVSGAAGDGVWGGDGADSLVGNGGDDWLGGEAGNDTLDGGAGNDSIWGDAGADSVAGGDGHDTIADESSSSLGNASNSNDTLLGGAGNDSIVSTGGADSINGGLGSDTLSADLSGATGPVIFQPTGSTSTVSFGSGLSSVINVEVFEIRGTSFADQIAGLSGNDTLRGGGGGDTLAGGAGYDYLYGEAGNDSIDVGIDGGAEGGDGNDTMSASASTHGNFYLYGGAGNDLLTSSGSFWGYLYGDGGNDTLVSGAADDDVQGGDGADSLVGNGADDWLAGNAGNDTLDGGAGNDSMWGGANNDVYIVNSAGDVVDETGGGGVDEVRASITRTLGAGFEHLTLTGAGNINGTGNNAANIMAGNTGNNRLQGLSGADTLTGGLGADTLEGGAANDLLQGGAGNDSISGGTELDTAIFEGSFAEYAITFDAVTSRYTFSRSGEVDLLSSDVELVQFGNDAGAITVDLRAAPVGTGFETIITTQGPSLSPVAEAGTDEDGNPATVQVAENSVAGLTVATFSATDTNLPAGDVLTFSLVNEDGTPALGLPFSVVKTGSTTAEIRTDGTLDFEATPSVTLRVRVTDVHGNHATQLVVVGLSDVNEAPVLVTTALSVDENQQSVGTILADDPDAVDSMVFALEPGALDNALFNVDPATGALTFVAAAGADFEAGASYTVRVRVSDAGDPTLTSVADVTITIQDVNDAPVLTTSALVVDENTQAVGTLAATDQDAVGPLVFALESGALDNALFNVDPDTGALSFVATAGANFEAKASYSVRVRVTDSGDPAVSTVADVAITVQDVNEAPVLVTTALNVDENRQSVGTLLASDPDTVASIVFSLVPGQLDNDLFTINAATGALAFVDPNGGNYDLDPSFTIRVRVADAGDPSLAAEADVTITLNDVNSAPVPTEDADLLLGSAGAETILALGGNDTILGSLGADRIDGGAGIDTVRFTTATRLDRSRPANSNGEASGDTYISIERFEGSAGADTLTSGSASDILDGRDGNDRLTAGVGADSLLGGNGKDKLLGGTGTNLLNGGAGADSMDGGSGADTFIGGLGADTITTSDDGVMDVLVYRSAVEGNDRIEGFVSGQDQVQISRAGFGLEEDFVLSSSTFVVGTAPATPGSDPVFLLNTTSGQLTFDTNGSEAGGAILVARFFSGTPALSDFVLVA